MSIKLRSVFVVLVAAGTALLAANPAAAAPAPRSPLDALPAGRPPLSVPYALGMTVYYRGHRTSLNPLYDKIWGIPHTPRTTDRPRIVIGGGGYAWAQLSIAATDMANVVGRISPSGRWKQFHISTGDASRVSVTTAPLVAVPEDGLLLRTDGRKVASFTGNLNTSYNFFESSAAGRYVVVHRHPNAPGAPDMGMWLWSPSVKPFQLPDGYRALGRLGAGWLGAPAGTTPGARCWHVAPASAPLKTRPGTLCSMTLPLVSADGAKAVVVQGGRVRVLDTVTGAQIRAARIPALSGWSFWTTPYRYLIPAAWESADSYLVTARDDKVIALLRCSISTGRCERAVRAVTRPGIDIVVTERGFEDVVY